MLINNLTLEIMEQPKSTQNLNHSLKILSLLYFIFLGSQVIFAIVALMQQKNTYFEFEDSEDIYIYIVPVLAIVAFVGSMFLFREQISALADKNSLKEKIMGYQTAYLLRMAFLEVACLFGIVAFLLKGNLFSLIFSGLIVLYFLALRPAKVKIEEDLEIN